MRIVIEQTNPDYFLPYLRVREEKVYSGMWRDQVDENQVLQLKVVNLPFDECTVLVFRQQERDRYVLGIVHDDIIYIAFYRKDLEPVLDGYRKLIAAAESGESAWYYTWS